jgi:cytochrome c2
MKNAFVILGFTVLVTLFYWYVGQQVPQKETYPPQSLEIRPDLTTEEMVEIGQEIVGGKGTCLTCHTIGSASGALRFPDLGNIGAVAGNRKPGMDNVQYLAESIYDPNAHIVEGFLSGMPVIHKPPISLNDDEILCVIAYLQRLGGTPTITMQTTHQFTGTAPPSEATSPTIAEAGVTENLDGPEIFNRYLCGTCHKMDGPDKMIGPSLYNVGKRLSRAELYESILDPDAKVAAEFPKGVMATTLNAAGFYEKVSSKELNNLVEYLASLKGAQ